MVSEHVLGEEAVRAGRGAAGVLAGDGGISISELPSSSRTLTVVLVVLGLLAGTIAAFVVVRQLTAGVKSIIERMGAVEQAARQN